MLEDLRDETSRIDPKNHECIENIYLLVDQTFTAIFEKFTGHTKQKLSGCKPVAFHVPVEETGTWDDSGSSSVFPAPTPISRDQEVNVSTFFPPRYCSLYRQSDVEGLANMFHANESRYTSQST